MALAIITLALLILTWFSTLPSRAGPGDAPSVLSAEIDIPTAQSNPAPTQTGVKTAAKDPF